MYTLTCIKHGNLYELHFGTITEAYQWYLKHFATIEEKLYYLMTCRKSLKSVTSKSTMELIFLNVFRNGVLSKPR